MNSDGKIEIFGGVKGQTNLMILKEAPKIRALEYCANPNPAKTYLQGGWRPHPSNSRSFSSLRVNLKLYDVTDVTR